MKCRVRSPGCFAEAASFSVIVSRETTGFVLRLAGEWVGDEHD
jgi:hypothetical protein